MGPGEPAGHLREETEMTVRYEKKEYKSILNKFKLIDSWFWCRSVFFFELFPALADPHKEKNGSKRNSGQPARKKKRRIYD